MACGSTLTASRKKTGYAKPKGYKAISFSLWDGANIIQNTANGVVTLPASMTTPPAIYRFEVKNTADNFIETATKDPVTMTGNKAGVGTFALLYCDRVKNVADAQALLDGVFNVFFEHNDGSATVAGSVNGGEIITIVESTDAQGFLFTLNTFEPAFMYTLATGGKSAYTTGLVANA
jgi:hypothetical protein